VNSGVFLHNRVAALQQTRSISCWLWVECNSDLQILATGKQWRFLLSTTVVYIIIFCRTDAVDFTEFIALVRTFASSKAAFKTRARLGNVLTF